MTKSVEENRQMPNVRRFIGSKQELYAMRKCMDENKVDIVYKYVELVRERFKKRNLGKQLEQFEHILKQPRKKKPVVKKTARKKKPIDLWKMFKLNRKNSYTRMT